VPVEGLRRNRAAALVKITRGRRPPELSTEPAQLIDELLAGREPARHQPRGALGGVPRAEMLDHGLRMHMRVWIGGELLHRR